MTRHKQAPTRFGEFPYRRQKRELGRTCLKARYLNPPTARRRSILSLADPNLGALGRQKRQQKFNTASSRGKMMKCKAMGSLKGNKNKRR